ncbi:MAG: hypothetical protein JWN50_43 [Parcubacteria group bacterium]|nr:hypothetical protein [Parcubacteria group bacterium]
MKTSLILLGLGLALFIPLASAHELQTDGSMGAVMHIDPNDNPGTNATSTFELIFQGDAPDLTKCDCHVVLKDATSTIYFAKVGDPDLEVTPKNMTFAYRFPVLGAYSLTVMGTDPKPFSLTYNISVATPDGSPDDDGGTMQMSPLVHSIHLGLFALMIGGAVYIILRKE